MPERVRVAVRESEREPKGLQDQGRVRLECADCGRALMEFQLTGNAPSRVRLDGAPGPAQTVVQALCGLCGGKSYQRTIEGAFHYGPAEDSLVCEYATDPPAGCDVAFTVRPKR